MQSSRATSWHRYWTLARFPARYHFGLESRTARSQALPDGAMLKRCYLVESARIILEATAYGSIESY